MPSANLCSGRECAVAIRAQAQAAWQNAIVSIGVAWIGDMSDGVPDMNCTAAVLAAKGALNAAYGYEANKDSDPPVLFKPTWTVEPDTFRPTYAGALSYFIGHECSDMDAVSTDNGFAFGYTALKPGPDRDDKKNWCAAQPCRAHVRPMTPRAHTQRVRLAPLRLGWEKAHFHSMKFLEGGAFCHAGVAQGKLTLTSRWRDANGDPVIGTVDKTFTRAAPTPPPPPPLYHKISPTNARDVRRPSSPARSSSLLRSRRQVHAQPGPGRHPASRGAPLVLGGAPGAPIAASLSCFAPFALAIVCTTRDEGEEDGLRPLL